MEHEFTFEAKRTMFDGAPVGGGEHHGNGKLTVKGQTFTALTVGAMSYDVGPRLLSDVLQKAWKAGTLTATECAEVFREHYPLPRREPWAWNYQHQDPADSTSMWWGAAWPTFEEYQAAR